MRIQCPGCGARYRIDPGKTGKTSARVKCPKCANLFTIELRPEKPREEAPVVASASSGPAKGNRVLVVDDSRFFRELITDVLKPLDLDFDFAANGHEALEKIRRQPPDLVIADLNLPGKNGYELIREVRQDPALGKVRLLAMSGVFRKEDDVAEAGRVGAHDFISKSFTPEQLQERVERLLGR